MRLELGEVLVLRSALGALVGVLEDDDAPCLIPEGQVAPLIIESQGGNNVLFAHPLVGPLIPKDLREFVAPSFRTVLLHQIFYLYLPFYKTQSINSQYCALTVRIQKHFARHQCPTNCRSRTDERVNRIIQSLSS